MSTHRARPAHRCRDRHRQGHGSRSRIPAHAPAHFEPLRPARRQGLHLREHVGSARSRPRLAPPAPSRPPCQAHPRRSRHSPQRTLAYRRLGPQAARRQQGVHPRRHRQLLAKGPGLDHRRASRSHCDLQGTRPSRPASRARRTATSDHSHWPTPASRTSTPPSTRPFWPKAFTASSPRSRSPNRTR